MKEKNRSTSDISELNPKVLEQKISKSDDPKKKISMLIELVAYHEKNRNYHLSLQTLDRALTMAIEDRNDDALATVYHITGRIYYSIKNYEKSIENYLNALTLRESLDDPDKISATLNNLSIVYIEILRYDNALECLFKALNCSEYTGDYRSLSGICNNIGILYLRSGDIDKANNYFEKSLKTMENAGDDQILSDLYMNIGTTLCETNDFKESLEYFEKSIKIKQKINDTRGLSSVMLNLGKAYQGIGNFSESLNLLNKSLEERKKTGDKKDLATINHAIGAVYVEIGDNQKARDYFEKAYAYSSGIDMPYHKNEIVKDLSEICKKLGDFDKAYKLLIEYYKIQEVINDNEKKTKIIDIELNHEIDKIERENKIFKEKNLELEKAKKKIDLHQVELNKVYEELAKVIQVKENLFGFISKDLKESMDSINSAIELMSAKKNEDSGDSCKYIKSISETVKDSLGLIERITRLSHLEEPSFSLKLTKKDIPVCLEKHFPLFEKTAQKKNISLKLSVKTVRAEVFIDESAFIEIIENVLENSIKYTEPGGIIEIEISHKSGNAVLTVKDNGLGTLSEYIPSIGEKFLPSSRNGTRGEKSAWLGLVIAKKLVIFHKGSISVRSEINSGTEFRILLPLA
ncbi:tetratricopeptide repeat-containing sensor histidine kinase [candidate division WOR-3 bacterium]|nr:tetratricopeptide repeat-containing sensor histidine kinase [candidate division WOR-3 bacterium]